MRRQIPAGIANLKIPDQRHLVPARIAKLLDQVCQQIIRRHNPVGKTRQQPMLAAKFCLQNRIVRSI